MWIGNETTKAKSSVCCPNSPPRRHSESGSGASSLALGTANRLVEAAPSQITWCAPACLLLRGILLSCSPRGQTAAP